MAGATITTVSKLAEDALNRVFAAIPGVPIRATDLTIEWTEGKDEWLLTARVVPEIRRTTPEEETT